MTPEQEMAKKEQEEISRQQYWHTTTVLAFIALVANLFKPANGSSLSCLEFCIATAMVLAGMLLGFRMVIVCHREYCTRGGEKKWWFTELKGAFFCNALIFVEGVGLIAYFALKRS